MKVNFIIESSRGLRYLGCATVSKQLMEVLKEKGIDVALNSKKDEFDLIHAHTFGPLAISQKRKARSIISAHSIPSINKGNIIFGDKSLWNAVYRKIYNAFDYVFAVSKMSVKELKDIGVSKPIYVLENGVNKSFFKYDTEKGRIFRDANGFSKNDYVVLNVAQITPRKGVYDFITVAKNNPDVKFLWVGGFPYFIASSDFLRLKTIIRHLPPNLRFTGYIEDIIGAYSGSDLLFTPTQGETFGLTIIEASACNLPVLTRRLEVFEELFDGNVLFGRDVEEFGSIIKQKPKKQKSQLTDRYDLHRIANDTISLYEKIIDS
ncbi:MAG: glycosyltransferase family 4 protein [Thermoplasmatota archaeon]